MTELSYGESVAAKAIAAKLRELLPKAEVDFAAISEEIVRATELTAVDTIEAREVSLQAAASALTEYYAILLRRLREERAALTEENRRMALLLAQRAPISAAVS